MIALDFYDSLCYLGGLRDVQSIISDYFIDQDPRVRTAALKAMVRQSLVLHICIKSAKKNIQQLFISFEFLHRLIK